MKLGKLTMIVLTAAVLVVIAAVLAVNYGPVSSRAAIARTENASEAAPVVRTATAASPYYALCNDSSHGYGCAGRQTWCGPERDNYAAAKADADAHKRANSSHQVTVYHVP